MHLLPFFQWCESTALSTAIRDSLWLFPVIEAGHLLALALIGGAVLIVDVRLFGWGMRRLSVAQVARDARPWLVGSLTAMLVTGVLLFLSEAIKCYYNPAFWAKMAFLLAAMIFTFTVRNPMALAERVASPARSRGVALLSILLWSGVGLSGRAIGFY